MTACLNEEKQNESQALTVKAQSNLMMLFRKSISFF